jgi:hypothetical protein
MLLNIRACCRYGLDVDMGECTIFRVLVALVITDDDLLSTTDSIMFQLRYRNGRVISNGARSS